MLPVVVFILEIEDEKIVLQRSTEASEEILKISLYVFQNLFPKFIYFVKKPDVALFLLFSSFNDLVDKSRKFGFHPSVIGK
jgi:hypothetical protein